MTRAELVREWLIAIRRAERAEARVRRLQEQLEQQEKGNASRDRNG